MKAIDKLKDIAAVLKSSGIDYAPKEAEILITEALCIGKSRLYSGGLEISPDESSLIDSLVKRRAAGEPIQYLAGHVDFYGLKINVGRGVLIPRHETELLVEETIKLLSGKQPPIPPLLRGGKGGLSILDLCTGSGCIAIALAKHFPDAIVYGIDKSGTAIQYAIRNAAENNIKNVHFVKGNLFESITVHCFDCIVSNPPYIKSSDIKNLQREIRDYEPIKALDGGEDGVDFYRRIFEKAPKFLKENGIIIIEIGYGQSGDVKLIAESAGFRDVSIVKDYAGIDRILAGRLKGEILTRKMQLASNALFG